MSAASQAAVLEQREALVARIEQEVTHRAELDGKGLILYFRVLLQDLPYDGAPSLLRDEHRAAIERLVERVTRFDIRIISIVGHTSEPGTASYNQSLAERRAQAVFDHMLHTIETSGLFSDNTLLAGVTPQGRGEEQLAEQTLDGSDHPLNRRVEIAYRLKIVFPQSDADNVPRSRYWKVDFAAGGGAFGLESGVGTLSMLPDDQTGQTQTISKTLAYEQLGVSLGLLSYLKKLKFIARFPKIKRLFEFLDPDLGGNYPRTEAFLQALGFSTDLVSEGGEFFTGEPLSFNEMSRFNFATVSANLSLGAGATGSLILLHSPNFFAYTVIYGAGLNIGFPDAGLNFVPAAWVQVHV